MFRKQRGITLIELVTVAVVVGILVAVAIPSYRSYLIRTQRSDAKTALLTLRAAQEKYYLQNNEYTDRATLGVAPFSENGLYAIDVQLPAEEDPQSYTAIATPVPERGQKDDKQCLTFTLTDVGLRSASGPGGTETCWR